MAELAFDVTCESGWDMLLCMVCMGSRMERTIWSQLCFAAVKLLAAGDRCFELFYSLEPSDPFCALVRIKYTLVLGVRGCLCPCAVERFSFRQS